MRVRPPTRTLRYGSYSYGRQQSRILDNGGNPDPATPRGGRRSSDCKLLFSGSNPPPLFVKIFVRGNANYKNYKFVESGGG